MNYTENSRYLIEGGGEQCYRAEMKSAGDKIPFWFWVVWFVFWGGVIAGPIALSISGALPEVGQKAGRLGDGSLD